MNDFVNRIMELVDAAIEQRALYRKAASEGLLPSPTPAHKARAALESIK